MDFVGNIFAPTTDEMLADVVSRVDKDLTTSSSPMILSRDVVRIVGEKDDDAIKVLNQLNARKVIRPMYDVNKQFAHESVGGFVAICERGGLGLLRVTEDGV